MTEVNFHKKNFWANLGPKGPETRQPRPQGFFSFLQYEGEEESPGMLD